MYETIVNTPSYIYMTTITKILPFVVWLLISMLMSVITPGMSCFMLLSAMMDLCGMKTNRNSEDEEEDGEVRNYDIFIQTRSSKQTDRDTCSRLKLDACLIIY